MKDLLKTAFILFIISLIAAGLLGFVDLITRDPIKQLMIKQKTEARKNVLKSSKFALKREKNLHKKIMKTFSADKSVLKTKSMIYDNYYTGYDKNGSLLGYVFEGYSPEGYAGKIEFVIGVQILTNDGGKVPVISSYAVIKSAETPGLGKDAEKLLLKFFKGKFKGMTSINPNSKVDTMTSATITSAALKDALYTSLMAARFIIAEYNVNLNIPEKYLKIIPYTRKLIELKFNIKDKTINTGMINKLFTAKFFNFIKGYVAKLYFKVNGKKYLAIAGIESANSRLYNTRLFEITLNTKRPFVNALFNRRLFLFSNEKKLKEAKGLNELDSTLSKSILQVYTVLKKMGKIK